MLSPMKAALRFRLRGGVQHLIVHVTNRCPLRCRHCFVRSDPAVRDLTPEELAPFVRALGRVSMVDLSGGEPFLRDDLPAVCALFPKSASIGIPTCGWDPARILGATHAVLQVVPVGRLYLVVSLDGFQETNDRLRGPGSFAHALATLRALSQVPGLAVKVNTVLCRDNLPELLEFMAFVREERPWFHSILLMRGEPRSGDQALPPIDELERIVPEIIRVQREYAREGPFLRRRITANYLRLLWDTSLAVLRGARTLPCLAGRAHLVILANGDVAPCELLPPVGNLRTASPEAILRGAALKDAVRAIQAGACQCTHNCNMVENILFNPRTYPRLLGLARARRAKA